MDYLALIRQMMGFREQEHISALNQVRQNYGRLRAEHGFGPGTAAGEEAMQQRLLNQRYQNENDFLSLMTKEYEKAQAEAAEEAFRQKQADEFAGQIASMGERQPTDERNMDLEGLIASRPSLASYAPVSGAITQARKRRRGIGEWLTDKRAKMTTAAQPKLTAAGTVPALGAENFDYQQQLREGEAWKKRMGYPGY